MPPSLHGRVPTILVLVVLTICLAVISPAGWSSQLAGAASTQAPRLPESFWRPGVIKRDRAGTLYLAPLPADSGPLQDAEPELALPIDAPEEIAVLVYALAPVYALDPNLVLALIAVESGFRTDAVSPRNASGLMQLIPATARRFGVANVFDPLENLHGGMKYLRWLLHRFDGDVSLVLAAYNSGEAAVERYGGIPPYAETESYVKAIKELYRQEFHPL